MELFQYIFYNQRPFCSSYIERSRDIAVLWHVRPRGPYKAYSPLGPFSFPNLPSPSETVRARGDEVDGTRLVRC